MESPFTKLHHVCVVVHDIEATMAAYENLGIGPWYDYPKGSAYVNLNVPDKEASEQMVYKVFDFENFQLQLCQPSELDSPQRRFLDQRGEGVYHLGFEVDDLEEGIEEGLQLGLNIISSGQRSNGSGFCYFDTTKENGVVLEIRKTSNEQVNERVSHQVSS